jgi:hypothetical protein
MTLDDPGLERLRAAFAASAEDAAPGASCPEPELLLSARRFELPPEAVRSLVAHTAACGACAEAWRLAGEVIPLLPQPAVVPGPSRSRPWWGGWASALAAAAVLVVALGALLGERRGPAPGYRRGAAPVLRSLVPEDRPLPRQACVLRWSPGPAGSRYSVDVARDDLTPIAAARGLDATEYRVPPESLSGLPKGATLLWRVEAALAGGGRLESVTFLAKLE